MSEHDRRHAELLAAFGAAFNRHDVDALMSMMTDDCVFFTLAGDGPRGNALRGQAAVRAAFEATMKAFPDAQWRQGPIFVAGDRGVSQWTFTGTRHDGSGRVEAEGCDLFTFRDGRIAVKDAFRKDRPVQPVGRG